MAAGEESEAAARGEFVCGATRLRIALRPYVLALESAFGTSHSSTTARRNALLTLAWRGEGADEPLVGYGECGLPPKKPGCYEADYSDVLRCFHAFCAGAGAGAGAGGGDPFAGLPPYAFAALRRGAVQPALEEALRALLVALDVHPLRGKDPSFRVFLSGLEMAALDLWGKVRRAPLQQLLLQQHDPKEGDANAGAAAAAITMERPRSFFTAALNDDLARIVESARRGLAHTPLLKIKLNDDMDMAARVLAALWPLDSPRGDAVVWTVDANAAWTPQVALRFLALAEPYLSRIFMVEQPFPLLRAAADSPSGVVRVTGAQRVAVSREELDEWRRVKEVFGARRVLVFGDESITDEADVRALRDVMHGCNVKLEKAGGFRAAVRAAAAARESGLLLWVGTMVGSSLNSTAAAHLLPLAHRGYGDCDGSLLVSAQSHLFEGGFVWEAHDGELRFSGQPGFGLRPRAPLEL
jgi:L-alanine-DL-glutamate epimerase-like enolase superfamily enzyme